MHDIFKISNSKKKLLFLFWVMMGTLVSRAEVGDSIVFGNYKVRILSEEKHEVSIGRSDEGYKNLAGKITLPSSFKIKGRDYKVVKIAPEGFSSCDIVAVSIPKTVTEIGNGAFRGCYDLTSVTIGEYVTKIGEDAFYGCTSLVKI